jgi:hypothetical protein
MLETPERAAGALTAALPANSSPAPYSDDDTISDNSFDAASDHFAFTPKRPGKLPRAWERKPATPFAPRTETQKIWKRVPLQDKHTNGTVEILATVNDGADARGTKRVRLTSPTAGSGKENYANTQWDKQSEDARRKVPMEQEYALRSTRNSLSPLRKDCTFEILNDPPPPTALELEADHVIRRLEEMQKAAELANTVSSDEGSSDTKALTTDLLQHTPQTPTLDKDKFEAACSAEEIASDDGEATTPSTNGFFTDSIIFDDQDSESEIDEDPIADDVTLGARNSDSDSEISNERSQSILLAPDDSTTPLCQDDEARDLLQAGSRTSLGSLEQQNLQSHTTEEAVAATTEAMALQRSVYKSTPASKEDVMPGLHGFDTISDHVDMAGIVQEHLEVAEFRPLLSQEEDSGAEAMVSESNNRQAEIASIHETSLAHTQATPHAATHLRGPEKVLDDVATTNTVQTDILIFGEADDHLSNQLFTPQAPIFSAPDAPLSDDTAYLHDFLTRARAKKAARAASSPEKTDHIASSPAKNTCQAFANLSTNSLSPSAAAQTDLGPEEFVDNTMNEDQATSPCRRSSRPRFPKPLKSVAPSIPSTIPVRRSNGTEFIFLPRSEAMQISLDTRTNTQRNKGEAVRPNIRLESLAISEISPIKERKKTSKAKKMVKWDEKLRQEEVEAVLEDQAVMLETRPETKPDPQAKLDGQATSEPEKSEKREKNARTSVKRLGTVNGTPAPKKKMMSATALPVPTRTLRARSKG